MTHAVPSLTSIAGPFVLLDDARSDGAVAARLFTSPLESTTAHTLAEVTSLIDRIDGWATAGSFSAGFLAYEAGQAFEPRLSAAPTPGPDGWPLGWFGRFAGCQRIAADAVASMLPDPAGAVVGEPIPGVERAAYEQAIATILSHIRAGDIYQANMTFNAAVAIHGHPLTIYARLRGHACAGYGGVVYTGDHWLLSCSPELFFSVRDGQIMARPMKGTAARLADSVADKASVSSLSADPKQRAENLMIVDLLRNDMSRVAVPGSVAVPALFRVESFPTIHQMVSDVTAQMQPGMTPAQMLPALFPCGSITGAPKISAMQIISAIENGPRGAYTGSIGYIAPDGDAAFNVAIRTLMVDDGALRDGDGYATLGLGSGIVADSHPGSEWLECLAKGEFVSVAVADFDLIETMRFDPLDGPLLLDRHLHRLGTSARAFGFSFDRHAIRNMLQHATFRHDSASRIRLRLSRRGSIAAQIDPLPEKPSEPVRVAIVPRPVPSHDIRLSHKTSDRGFYDDALAAANSAGCFEAILVDDDGQLTEGCFTNIFVERDGMLLTPPLSLGLLPGVLRAELIDSGKAREAVLTADDLAQPFFIGNALRGLIRAIPM